MIPLVVLAALVALPLCLVIYARWNFGKFEKQGIPVAKGDNFHCLLGTARVQYTTAGAGGLEDTKWMKKYGPIFGVYEGREPQTFIAVPELVRLICVKDSDYFNAKRELDFGDPVTNEMPDFQPCILSSENMDGDLMRSKTLVASY